MSHLYLFDSAGACIARLSGISNDLVAETAIRNGAVAHWQSEEEHPVDGLRLVDGVLHTTPPAPRAMDYRERRYLDYPPLGDQLDALWHAMQDGVLPQIPGFYDRIAAVKAAHPKPQE